MALKIVLTDCETVSANDLDLKILEKFGEVIYYPETPKDLIAERIKDADVIICNKTVIGKNEIDAAKNLKLITLFATGYNNIDVKYAATKNIAVCNAGSYSTHAVAQQTFSYILDFASKIALYDSDVKGGSWIRSRLFSVFSRPTLELLGKTIGIFGYGAIGRQVANIANAFGMNILVCTRTPRPELDTIPVTYVDLDTLLENSDFVTLHCPLNEQTKGLFDENAFKRMKKGAYFINTARGAVIDEQALVDALNTDHLAGAAIDVLAVEPMQADCPLLNAKNIRITPHVAWAPKETRMRVLDTVVKNIETFLEGCPQNRVN